MILSAPVTSKHCDVVVSKKAAISLPGNSTIKMYRCISSATLSLVQVVEYISFLCAYTFSVLSSFIGNWLSITSHRYYIIPLYMNTLECTSCIIIACHALFTETSFCVGCNQYSDVVVLHMEIMT